MLKYLLNKSNITRIVFYFYLHILKKINDLIEENKEIPLYKNLKFTDLKCWEEDQNFAFTVTLTLSPKYFFNSAENLSEVIFESPIFD
jgi:hypothetical protein